MGGAGDNSRPDYCPERAWAIIDERRKIEIEWRNWERKRIIQIVDLLTERRVEKFFTQVFVS